MTETVEDHPVEDMFGTEILPGDLYWKFGNGDVVSKYNLHRYLIEVQQIECYRAG